MPDGRVSISNISGICGRLRACRFHAATELGDHQLAADSRRVVLLLPRAALTARVRAITRLARHGTSPHATRHSDSIGAHVIATDMRGASDA
jgi:hypothetical protein